jgi:hypothetical protein
VLTHGGFGYAKEHHVDRLLRRVTLTRGEIYFTIHLAASLRDIPASWLARIKPAKTAFTAEMEGPSGRRPEASVG